MPQSVARELHSLGPNEHLGKHVERLLGSRDRGVTKAVATYLQSNPGTIDDVNFNYAAAAVPYLDPNLAARLIAELPVTRINMAIKPIDFAATQKQFAAALDPLTPTSRFRVVKDLIETSTVELLELAPADRLTPPAKQLINKKFAKDLRRSLGLTLMVAKHLATNSENLDAIYGRWGEVDGIRERAATVEHKGSALRKKILSLFDRYRAEVTQYAAHVENVSQYLANHPNSSPALLEKLAHHRSKTVRRIVASNTTTPLETLMSLASSWRKEIRQTANATLVELGYRDAKPQSQTPIRWLDRKLARSSREPSEQLARLHPLRSWKRAQIASDERTPEHRLHRLGFSFYRDVRNAALRNPNAPAELLATKYASSDWRVVDVVSTHPKTPAEILRLQLYKSSTELPLRERSLQTRLDALQNLLARGEQIPPQPMNAILNEVDIHVYLALTFGLSLDADLTGRGNFVAAKLDETSQAIELGRLPKKPTISTWKQLPNLYDQPFPLSPDAHQINGRVVDGLVAVVAKTGRDLDQLHLQMGNCLDRYIHAARAGRIFIASFEDTERNELYAAGWTNYEGILNLYDVDSKGNAKRLPPGFKSSLLSLTSAINTARAQIAFMPHAIDKDEPAVERPAVEVNVRRQNIRNQDHGIGF